MTKRTMPIAEMNIAKSFHFRHASRIALCHPERSEGTSHVTQKLTQVSRPRYRTIPHLALRALLSLRERIEVRVRLEQRCF